MNWDDISDDDFIAEAQRRVSSGRYSPDAYMSPHQSDDRAKLAVLRGAIIQARVELMPAPPWLQKLAETCDQLDCMQDNPLPERAYAVNTAFVGREAKEDHAPRQEINND